MTRRNLTLGWGSAPVLCNLPIELKFMIVQAAFEADAIEAKRGENWEEPLKHSLIVCNGRCSPGTRLSTLRQLNKCFRAVTDHFVWKTIDVSTIQNVGLDLNWTRNLHQLRGFRSTERILWTSTDSQRALRQVLFMQDVLVTSPLSARPRIRALEIGAWSGCRRVSETVSRILIDGLPTLSGSLVILRLNLEALNYTAITVTKILRPLHLLEKLQLVGVLGQNESEARYEVEMLGKRLGRLSRLKVIELTNCPSINSWWDNERWTGPIQSLKLCNCSGLSSEMLAVTLRQLGTRLEHLELFNCITPDNGKCLGQIQMPYLRSMQLAVSPLPRNLMDALVIGAPQLSRLTLISNYTTPVEILDYLRSWPRLNQLKCKLKGGEGSLDLIIHCFHRQIDLEESFY
ncbi:hypothetical protein CROQUDRAFT_658761 [Cronartium quercuum f. sp. fusiforme G11]|uniref:F-box domain-containing protein n=1 Tax=Cronartium quercuum f. sp. fusiforme G11 TaxID=708437 RepID=A0A9P6NJJ9_9BASI|nr:hypothetical protein CROQUDRAFT_658761 [Cronartium quercuum f. sp. fusiforme G11]